MIKWIVLIALILFTNSCDKVTKKYKACSIKDQNEFVYRYMQKNYLWNSTMPELDYLSYNSPEELLEDLKDPKDHWSFIIDTKALNSYFNEGKYIGLGIKFSDENGDIYISLVYQNSPAFNAGIKRGMKLISINGKLVKDMNSQEIHEAFGKNEVGVAVNLELEYNNQINEYNLTKAEIDAKSVITTKIINDGNNKIGYIVFDKFVGFSNDELDRAFKEFKSANINKLIVDLRYNEGGLVDVAQHLASLIHPSNDIFVKMKFNQQNSIKNSQLYFTRLNNSLENLDGIYFITTKYTCSASEAVINGLKPYVDNIFMIGQKSCGKPVGMIGDNFCGKSILPIEFKITNANDEGDYFGGMTPNCYASDDIKHSFGDRDESMLRATLDLIDYNVCESSSNKQARRVSNKSRLQLFGIHKITGAY